MKIHQSKFLRGGSCLLLALGLTLAVSAEPENKPERPAKVDHMKAMADELGLTPEQKAQLKEIMQGQQKELKALREDESLDRKAKGAKMREIQEAGRGKIRALLTPEQQKKFDAMPKPGRGERHRKN